MDPVTVVWLKRDLRLHDHRPLCAAAAEGPVHLIYVFEPSLWSTEEYSWRQLEFVHTSLAALQEELAPMGAQVDVVVGEVVESLAQLHADHGGFTRLRSHQETGNDRTYARDLNVGAWCRARKVEWMEDAQDGVIRRLGSRDGWARRWQQRMNEAQADRPARIPPSGWSARSLPPLAQLAGRLGVSYQVTPPRPSGEAGAEAELDGFLRRRGERYSSGMSSPLTAPDVCSRLSPHLAWGTISMRRVHQRTRDRMEDLRWQRKHGESTGGWGRSLRSFHSRLHWRCHFMQKLEDEPELEFHALSCALEEVGRELDPVRFAAWKAGETGVPMVDACMRMLRETGWINFRMRAMLVSFASYQLWMPWQDTGRFLAAQFTDFEPGIHWSQMQMQSGVTGINALRIYSPVKQAADQDPDGEFLARWLPELERVPAEFRAAPWEMPPLIAAAQGFELGRDYPEPVVDPKQSYHDANKKMRAARATLFAKEEASRVVEKHGSRKGQAREEDVSAYQKADWR